MSQTPYTKAHAVPASTGFGVDDYCDNYVHEDKVAALELAANGLRESSANYVRCVRKATEGGSKTDLHAAGLGLLKAFEDFDALQPKEPHE